MKSIILLFVLFIITSNAQAKKLWYELGVGASNSGAHFGATLNYSEDDRVYIISLAHSDRYFIFGDEGDASYDSLYVGVGTLELTKWKYTKAIIGIGAFRESVLADCESDGFFGASGCEKNKKDAVVSIPIDITKVFGKYFGGGFNVHFNINEVRPTVAFRFILSLGKFH